MTKKILPILAMSPMVILFLYFAHVTGGLILIATWLACVPVGAVVAGLYQWGIERLCKHE